LLAPARAGLYRDFFMQRTFHAAPAGRMNYFVGWPFQADRSCAIGGIAASVFREEMSSGEARADTSDDGTLAQHQLALESDSILGANQRNHGFIIRRSEFADFTT
jgi:hypothetical protein